MGVVLKRFSEEEICSIEERYSDGITLAQVLELFSKQGMPFSEATFRKYVQLGLLGRSRRIGRKGKHQGSLGVYPSTTIRKINEIRTMISANYTIEDIQNSFLRFKNEIEVLKGAAHRLLQSFSEEIQAWDDLDKRQRLMRELTSVEVEMHSWVNKILLLERQLVSPKERAVRKKAFSSGAVGAEDLL